MQGKRWIAGIAAAATLFGGALFSTTAMADETDSSSAQSGTTAQAAMSTITVNNPQAGHTYKPYQFATFSNVQTDNGEVTSMDVDTADITTIKDAIPAVLGAAREASGEEVPQVYSNNPAAYVAGFDAAQLRTFADSITGLWAQTPSQYEQTASANNTQLTLNVPEGWYVILDTVDGTPVQGATAIVATKLGANSIKIKNAVSPEANIDTSGSYNVKTQDAMAPYDVKKSVDQTDIHDGTTVNYTVVATIPAAAAGHDSYALQLADTADAGLHVAADQATVTAGSNTLTRDTDYTLTSTTDDANKTLTTLTINNGKAYAGQTITLTYPAQAVFGNTTNELKNTVASSAVVDGANVVSPAARKSVAANTNATATVTGATAEASVYTHDYSFTKIGVDGDAQGLNGAQFSIKNADGKFGHWTIENGWTWDNTESAVATSQDVTGADGQTAQGQVVFNNLQAGSYTIHETQAPNGYAQNLRPTFTVTITTDGTHTNDSYEISNNTLGLMDKSARQLKNVKSITQLPLTGGAGITMIIAAAILLGGLAALIAWRTRKVNRALNR